MGQPMKPNFLLKVHSKSNRCMRLGMEKITLQRFWERCLHVATWTQDVSNMPGHTQVQRTYLRAHSLTHTRNIYRVDDYHKKRF